jgi:DNA-binding MarR family transcriptional regulator
MGNPEPPPSPKGCTNFKVRHLARLLSRQYDAELAPTGLKITQYSLLKHVLDLGPLAPGELAQRMGMDPSTLTRNLKPLAASGWLAQTLGRDARSRLVAITPEGRAKLATAKGHWKAAQGAINARLGPQRVAALHELLDACSTLLQASGPAASA